MHEENATVDRIAETTLPNGLWVSTMLVPNQDIFNEGPPLIFETMVFFRPKSDRAQVDIKLYSTKDEALEGHELMVVKWSSWTRGDVPIPSDAMTVMYPKD